MLRAFLMASLNSLWWGVHTPEIRRGMILFIDTGLSVARVSPLNAARRSGLVPANTRTNRTALKLINRWLTDRGASAAWSKTYPEG